MKVKLAIGTLVLVLIAIHIIARQYPPAESRCLESLEGECIKILFEKDERQTRSGSREK
jgi:hypothetical protein